MANIYPQSVEDAIDKLKFAVKAVAESLILNAEFADELIEKPVTPGLITTFLRRHSGLSQMDATDFESSAAHLSETIKTCSLAAKEFYQITSPLIRRERACVKRNLQNYNARITNSSVKDKRTLIRKKLAEIHLEILDDLVELTIKIYQTKRKFELIHND